MSLVFDEASHKYYNETGLLPSVTEVLRAEGITPDFSAIDPKYAERGAWVHAACEAIDKNDIMEVNANEDGYLKAYLDFLRDFKPSWDHIELALAHPLYHYAGRFDRAFPLMDIKTGAPGSGEPLQLAAYYDLLIINGYKCKPEGMFLYLSLDGTYKTQRLMDLNRLARIFQAVLATYNYKRRK